MILYQSIGIGIVTIICYSHPVLGYSQLDRPIVSGVLVGLIMGDIALGAMIGASLELIFIGKCCYWRSITSRLLFWRNTGSGICHFIRNRN